MEYANDPLIMAGCILFAVLVVVLTVCELATLIILGTE
jgi:hypothetical protein